MCKFLGKEVPDVEFPRVNETASMHDEMSIIAGRGIRNLLTRILPWIGSLMAVVLLVTSQVSLSTNKPMVTSTLVPCRQVFMSVDVETELKDHCDENNSGLS